MIVQCGVIKIDTILGWEEHRKTINKDTHCFCNDNKPIQWFTQPQGREGRDRFYHLHYNKKGDALQEITSWDDPPPMYREVKRVKGEEEVCYFTKQNEQLEYCMVKERYYEKTSENPVTHWKEGWTEPAHQAMPISQETKKKRWGLF